MRKKYVILGFVFICIIAFLLYWPNRWHYIVIHHSAGNYGNVEFLQKIHDQRQGGEPIHAISYHYVIGNGNGMKDGEIGSDIRKKLNLWGVHVSGNNWDRNFRGIGICIIGNLENKPMTPKQYESLLRLTTQLMNKYNIDFEDVGFHGKIPGESTKCPGKYFPYEKFKKDLKEKQIK
jgi:N-acetyl-anhydromuramyl-L-alanine amidase AmpD